MEKSQVIPTVEQICALYDFLSPCMDNYLYFYDVKNDYYCISENAVHRFAIPATRFHNSYKVHEQFVYSEDYKRLLSLGKENDVIHEIDCRWLDKKGMPVWVNCRGKSVHDDEGELIYVIGCVNEIGKEQRADNVSGLRSATLFYENLEKRLKRGNIKGFLMRIGIDGMKEINENFGIDYGNMVLQRTAECVQSVIHKDERIYRIVSDEFIISDFSGRGIEEATRLYKRINWMLGRFIQQNSYDVFFTVSAGIVLFDSLENQSYQNMMKLSEFALNASKDNGRNQYYVYDEADYQHFIDKCRLAHIMRQAVNNDYEGFEVYYQPIMDIVHNRLCGAEALMRFRSEETGIVSPAEFIPILEETGLIIPLGMWIIEKAIQVCKEIQKTFHRFRISVNLSYIQVQKSNILAQIIDLIEQYELSPDCLMIELTESGFMADSPKFARFCEGVKEQGILLALDDFGSGYSNFRYLFDLNPFTLKIDRAFTVKAIQSEHEFRLLRHMIEMAHSINLKFCIEGVETQEDLTKICEIEPDYIQGYFFGKPVPLPEFLQRHVL